MKKSAAHSIGIVLVAIFITCFPTRATGQIVINEILASNQNGYADDDGEYPDWIELFNSGDTAVSLAGYGISDDPEEPFKYELPDVEIAPGDYYLLFASDKNRPGFTAVWETVVREGDDTSYLVPGSAVSTDWINSEFDDSGWDTGPLGVGYGDGDDNTTVSSGTISIFTRTKFTIESLSTINSMILHVDFDDGYTAYLNGAEIHRENMTGESPQDYNAVATTYSEARLTSGQNLPGISLNHLTDLLVEGDNVLAIQVHNNSNTSSDLTMIPFLSLGRSEALSESRGVASQINLESETVAYPHLNFQLSSDGETVLLTSADSVLADSIRFPELRPNESYGRSLENSDSLLIYTQSTPFEANATEGYAERLPEPSLSLPGGFYDSPIDLSLADTSLGQMVRFTVDGSEPTINSLAFGEFSRHISKTFTLRFRAIQEGKLSSDIVTQTYFIGTDHDLPVIAISTHPDNFFDYNEGIYVEGPDAQAADPHYGANYWEDKEVPIHIELYEEDGSLGFSTKAGTKIYGAWSRAHPLKSLAIYFRGEYGNPELEYKLFREKELDRFESFVLRNSGNDYAGADENGNGSGYSHFRDALMKTIVQDVADIDYQAYEPAVVYINGEYWGIHNIREKINEHFIASNHNISPDEVDLLENDGSLVYGSAEMYGEFMSELESADMSNQEEYESVVRHVDLDNYIDYMIAEIYYVNQDWPGNNIKYWRERKSYGKWRWIMYDTDFGFNLYGQNYHENMLEFSTAAGGTEWPNPDWSTYVFRKFLENESFEQKFISRFGDLLNTAFRESHMLAAIDSLAGRIESEMGDHRERWGGTVSSWQSNVNTLRGFAENRSDFVASHIREFFGVGERTPVTVTVSNEAHGRIRVNRFTPQTYPWTGSYFGGNPVELTAIPEPGYRFTGWSGANTSTERTIQVDPSEEPNVTALFEAASGNASDIVINEIMYNAEEENDPGDWVELYNSSGAAINLSGWIIQDEDDTHAFTFPDETIIDADGYLVVVEDLDMFSAIYDDVSPVTGDMGFGLAGGDDQVRLFDDSGMLIDSVAYQDIDPWPSAADGTGHSLELADPGSDNELAESWTASVDYGGTPGAKNGGSVSNESEDGLPKSVKLDQNYPNPFNPSTIISFELPQRALVKLKVFDMLGREVSELQNGVLAAGAYAKKWNAGSFSSGVYLYRLEVNGTAFTKKMLLIK